MWLPALEWSQQNETSTTSLQHHLAGGLREIWVLEAEGLHLTAAGVWCYLWSSSGLFLNFLCKFYIILLWPRTSGLIKIGKLLALKAVRVAFKRQYKRALSEQHFQWCSFQIAGNNNRGKNIFISAQGVLMLKLQIHMFINITHISRLVVLMQTFPYCKRVSEWVWWSHFNQQVPVLHTHGHLCGHLTWHLSGSRLNAAYFYTPSF